MKLKWLPLLLASSVGAMSAQAASENEVELLVGSYTQGKSQGIYRLQFNSDTGRITPEPLQVFKTANPSWLTLSKDQQRLFVVNENGKGQADVVGRVSSLAIDPKTNQLTLINQVKSLGEEPTHSSLSADERYLFVANYGAHEDPGGSLAVLPINDLGQLQPVTQMSSHQASLVNPERQMSAHVHSVVSSPDGKFVFANDLGADKIFVYQYDPQANPEHPLVAANPPAVELPAGSGPRHLLFSKEGKHAYLTAEMSAQVFVFDFANGQLKQRQAVDLAHGQPQEKRAAGALHASADGKFLYVSNRGKANELLVFAIDPVTGELTEIQRRSVEGDHPREFTLSPNGKFLLVANQMSNAIVVIERDGETGKLGKTLQTLPMDAPSDVKFINRP
ncbi:lactonase family protein [Pseudomonas psychrophila]|uniref:lactonase family protein n=1 Tax=Pseudomonas psychrophila TaxID=122355 RepID=UPI00031C10D3|nr:lactonase family protein [Pseudomonas psychrophila]